MERNHEQLRTQEYYDTLADKVEELMRLHGGKPSHLQWTVGMLRQGHITKVKADYWQQRDKLELYFQDIRDLLDGELG